MGTPINQVTPKQGIFFGLIVAGLGTMIMLRAANVIRAGATDAPSWVVGMAGFLFFLVGAYLISYGIRNAVGQRQAAPPPDPGGFSVGGWLLGSSVLTGLGLIGAWVALGPGARTFQGGVTGAESEGRIVFGLGAAITLLLAAFVWFKGFQELIARRHGRSSGRR